MLATNIAETAITIPRVAFVVDCGLVKAKGFHARVGFEALLPVPTSQAAASQRAGRAGRDGPGKCFRLYPESEFLRLPPTSLPEIRRVSLSGVVLQLLALGVADPVAGFDYLERPPLHALRRALEVLVALGAVAPAERALTATGRLMAALPLEPQFGRAVVAARALGCVRDVVDVVAALSVENVFYAPRDRRAHAARAHAAFRSRLGDHFTALGVLRAYRACAPPDRAAWCRQHFVNARALDKVERVAAQLRDMLARRGVVLDAARPAASAEDESTQEPVRRAFVQGFVHHVALLCAPRRRRRRRRRPLVSPPPQAARRQDVPHGGRRQGGVSAPVVVAVPVVAGRAEAAVRRLHRAGAHVASLHAERARRRARLAAASRRPAKAIACGQRPVVMAATASLLHSASIVVDAVAVVVVDEAARPLSVSESTSIAHEAVEPSGAGRCTRSAILSQ